MGKHCDWFLESIVDAVTETGSDIDVVLFFP